VARRIVAAIKPYVVDIDLSKFFDRIHHDRLVARLGQQVADTRILRLVGLRLRSGIMANGLVTPATEGAVQGSPLSPLLSNIVLDELDKELERRGLEFCRFADDCNLFVKTPKAAQRVMSSVSGGIVKLTDIGHPLPHPARRLSAIMVVHAPLSGAKRGWECCCAPLSYQSSDETSLS